MAAWLLSRGAKHANSPPPQAVADLFYFRCHIRDSMHRVVLLRYLGGIYWTSNDIVRRYYFYYFGRFSGLGIAPRAGDPNRNPVSNPQLPKLLSPKPILWIGAAVVIVVLADMINLGMTFILVAAVAALQSVGPRISDILVKVAAWIGAGVSLACAAAVWWTLWKRFKAPLEGKES